MTIAKGTCLGPYEIEEEIGAGGMGEVYRARDTRLDRVVAIKVLPDHLAQSPELRQRMEREAKAVSSLSHPNICALYDIGHEDGVDYLVMEFIDGETLGERLSQGPMPLEDTLRYGVEIADALEKAHRQGIVHRDIKPGNIMLTASGAKLLDFGLAKADGGLGGDADLTVSPTVSKPLTTAGTVLGTYQYMAPEQLEGKEVDARTDIFSLGAVLYEMVTGRRAFAGGSQASLIGAIMTEQPAPASTLQPMTPPAFDRVIQTCLSKEPEERWQTAHDVKLQLQWIAEGGSVVGLPAPVAARRKSRERLAWVTAAVAGVAAVLFAVGFFLRAQEIPHQVRFEITPDAKLAQVGSPRISPDGRIIAFQAIDSGGNGQIWLRPLDSLEARPLAGSEGAVTDGRPMWSPDSRYIAFFAGGKLKKVPVAGGPAQTICDANGADGSWSSRGEIVFDGQANAPLMRVSAAGGIVRPEVSPDDFEGSASLGWPEFLPDGKRFLFISDLTGEEGTIMLHEVGTTENTALTPADSRVQYAEPGFLIYVLDGMLVGHPFDADRAELIGEPMPLADNVGSSAVGLADFSAAADGTLVFRSGESGGRRLLWFDRAGLELSAVAEGDEFRNTSLSPDGSRVVSGIADDDSGNRDLWIHDLDRGVASRFTFDPAADSNPLWSPDGTQIVFSSTRDEKRGLYRKDASGVGPAELLLDVADGAGPNTWSSDGRFLLYNTQGADTTWDIWALSMDGSGEAFPVLQSEFFEVRPSFSPDGKWFAYESNESGRSEVYVRQFPGPGGQWQVSTDGGSEPVWSAVGNEVIFLDVAGNLSVVPVETGATFTAGLPEVLFDPAVFPTLQRNRYLATSDGERFLVLATMSGESIRPATVVLNWSAGLED
ncbi:MAG: protein kinase [Acidobacteria bacterium]|nr:protein kinase [Candidatus Sulfomarinibacter sp. MAG AM1]